MWKREIPSEKHRFKYLQVEEQDFLLSTSCGEKLVEKV